MIPIGDDNSRRHGSAPVTWVIIAANILVFIFLQGFGSNVDFLSSYATVPAEILSGRDIAEAARRTIDPWTGRAYPTSGLGVTPIPVFLTLITSMFMHGGIAHLAGNMLFLGIFGDNVECRIGKLRYLILYLVSGVIGTLAHVGACALTGQGLYTPLVGASGAISGVLGAYLALFPGNRVTVLIFGFIPSALSAWLVIGLWFVMQVSGSLTGWSSGGVAHLAHVGGFLIGWFWARRYRRDEARRLEARRAARARRGRSPGADWWIVG